jgi:biotin synthase-related radical SAM superfamily protein
LVDSVRVAFGTGVVLGLWRGQLSIAPTTAHFMTYYNGRCNANCQFCPQARESTADLKMLSRVVWPISELGKVLAALGKNSNDFKRVCIQAVNYPKAVDDLCEFVARVKSVCNLPISVSCQPLKAGDIQKLADAGGERVSVALDAATPELFERIKGGFYTWEGYIKVLERARATFDDRVSTHLIAGLGESEEEMVRAIQLLHDRGITIGLFAFTPIAGTALSDRPQPDVSSYRRIQLAIFFIINNMSRGELMRFDDGRIVEFGVGQYVLNRTVASGAPFLTSGCPDCNRPFYNESPKGPIYNYPRKPTSKEIERIKAELSLIA